MYRLRSVDTGRPLVILDKVLEEYGESDVHTLHQNNMRLGEDRYLTTLMKKHLPDMKYAYCGLAIAYTICPDRWSTFLSQRRRWINSTIHNLLELLIIEELGGVSFLHMSIVILVDLLGTIMLPSIGGSLIYLIYAVAKHSNRHAMISLLTVAGIYALSALLYIFNRRAELLGWMIIYLMAFPVFCIILPIYSWWHQDDFTWGAYPAVDVEKRKKLSQEVGKPEPFDPRSIPLQRWDNYASTNRLPGCRSALRESDVQ
jgi:chitin synthase